MNEAQAAVARLIAAQWSAICKANLGPLYNWARQTTGRRASHVDFDEDDFRSEVAARLLEEFDPQGPASLATVAYGVGQRVLLEMARKANRTDRALRQRHGEDGSEFPACAEEQMAISREDDVVQVLHETAVHDRLEGAADPAAEALQLHASGDLQADDVPAGQVATVTGRVPLLAAVAADDSPDRIAFGQRCMEHLAWARQAARDSPGDLVVGAYLAGLDKLHSIPQTPQEFVASVLPIVAGLGPASTQEEMSQAAALRRSGGALLARSDAACLPFGTPSVPISGSESTAGYGPSGRNRGGAPTFLRAPSAAPFRRRE